jgi:quercetin dioxygenase-like cupin family protein
MGVVDPLELQPLADPRDPDDWRPRSRWALASDPRASLAVIAEEIAPGDRIPLHRHRIDEVLLYQSGAAEVRIGEETFAVGAGSIAFVPAGEPHGTTNTGDQPVRVQAVFPSHAIDIEYLERNPAPGSESDPPQAPVSYDARTGAVTRL